MNVCCFSARNIGNLGGEPVKNNLKPMGVRKSGLVPHVLAAKPVSISKPPKPAVEEVYIYLYILGLAIEIRNRINPVIFGPDPNPELDCGLLFFYDSR